MVDLSQRGIPRRNILTFESVSEITDFIRHGNLSDFDDDSCVSIDLNFEKYGLKNLDSRVLELVQRLYDNGFLSEVWVNVPDGFFNHKDIEHFMNLEKNLKDVGVEFFIGENDRLYSLDETTTAYFKAQEIIDYVNGTKASPFEKYLMIYGYVTSFAYNENEDDIWSSRNLISVLLGNNIVCVGYSDLLKYLLNGVGIHAESQILTFENDADGKKYGHMNNLIFLKDKKYGIDGVFYADSCWDSVSDKNEAYMQYLYALVPIDDVKFLHTKRTHAKVDKFFKHLLYETKSIDDVMFNYFYSNSLCQGDFDYDLLKMFECKVEIPEMTDEEFVMQENNGCDVLTKYFKKYSISPDIYSRLGEVPECFDPNFLLVLAMNEKKYGIFLNYYVKKFKEYENEMSKGNSDDYYIELLMTRYYIDNIYEELEYFRDIGGYRNFSEGKVKEYFLSLHQYYNLRNKIKKFKDGSVPIPAEKFQQALTMAFKYMGMSDEFSKFKAERTMKNNIDLSEKLFDIGATNCFRTEKLKEREKKQ